MKRSLDDALCRDFPLLFRERHGKKVSLMWCGFECGNGWEPLIREVANKIEPLLQKLVAQTAKDPVQTPDSELLDRLPSVVQVKQKYGALMIYMYPATKEMLDIIESATKKSRNTCEICGKLGERRDKDYIFTLCDDHNRCSVDEILTLLEEDE